MDAATDLVVCPNTARSRTTRQQQKAKLIHLHPPINAARTVFGRWEIISIEFAIALVITEVRVVTSSHTAGHHSEGTPGTRKLGKDHLTV
jgi:hypothetical protein